MLTEASVCYSLLTVSVAESGLRAVSDLILVKNFWFSSYSLLDAGRPRIFLSAGVIRY